MFSASPKGFDHVVEATKKLLIPCLYHGSEDAHLDHLVSLWQDLMEDVKTYVSLMKSFEWVREWFSPLIWLIRWMRVHYRNTTIISTAFIPEILSIDLKMDTLKINGNKLFTKLHGAESEIFENIFYSSELLKHNIFVEKVTILLQRIPYTWNETRKIFVLCHILRFENDMVDYWLNEVWSFVSLSGQWLFSYHFVVQRL